MLDDNDYVGLALVAAAFILILWGLWLNYMFRRSSTNIFATAVASFIIAVLLFLT